MKLSIIIPMYKVELYVERCLLSTQKQDIPYSDYEVIAVNDGSPDNSLNIALQIAEQYPNIKVITRENGGLSAARNTGVLHASGDYIWFVDSDDWIEENCLGSILHDCYEKNLDGLIIQGIRVIDGKSFRCNAPFSSDNIQSGIEMMKDHLVNCAAVKTIIKRSILVNQKFRFYEGIFHEDQEFTPRIYYSLQRILESNYYVYYNRLNANSITQSVNPKKGFDLLKVADNLFLFINDIPFEDRQPFYDFISLNMNQAFSNIVDTESGIKKEFISKVNRKKYLLRCFLRTSMIKYKLEGILLNFSPFSVLRIYYFFNRTKTLFIRG